MGLFQSTPEFVTGLADRHVKTGETVILKCEAKREALIATWEKNGRSLECVQDKHKISQTGTMCVLEIANAQEGDEGIYTVNLRNRAGHASRSAMVTVELDEWRTIQWKEDPMINELKNFTIKVEAVTELRFLMYGPVGAGKSSIINTIKSIFEGRQFINYLAAAGSSKSHTINYRKCSVAQDGLYPFAFYDIMGVEEKKYEGVLTDDIISALNGHVKVGYPFRSDHPLTKDSLYYNKEPTMNDGIHCLVNVMPADTLALIKLDFIEKMKAVRKTASNMEIPQVVFLTRVDCACSITKDNLRNVYKSKKIRDKIHECSDILGIPPNCIFPVRNYHDETRMNEDINCLMLDVLTQMVHWAHDYVVKCSSA